MTPEMEFFARVDNLFDQDYQQVFGFQSAGIAAYAGVRMTLGGASPEHAAPK
jgi:vitamin B12 transporter